jgi:hypothetical protein
MGTCGIPDRLVYRGLTTIRRQDMQTCTPSAHTASGRSIPVDPLSPLRSSDPSFPLRASMPKGAPARDSLPRTCSMPRRAYPERPRSQSRADRQSASGYGRRTVTAATAASIHPLAFVCQDRPQAASSAWFCRLSRCARGRLAGRAPAPSTACWIQASSAAAERLAQRARPNGRSLPQEVKDILERAAVTVTSVTRGDCPSGGDAALADGGSPTACD